MADGLNVGEILRKTQANYAPSDAELARGAAVHGVAEAVGGVIDGIRTAPSHLGVAAAAISAGAFLSQTGSASAHEAPPGHIIVVEGDMLEAIGADHGLTVDVLLSDPDNVKFRANPDRIDPGDVVDVSSATLNSPLVRTVEVQPGDTLRKIGAEHGLSVEGLLADPDNVKFRANPDRIDPGDVVDVSGSSSIGVHNVTSGDTFWNIYRGLISSGGIPADTTFGTFRGWNPDVKDPDLIYPGQRIYYQGVDIPKPSAPVEQESAVFVPQAGDTLGKLADVFAFISPDTTDSAQDVLDAAQTPDVNKINAGEGVGFMGISQEDIDVATYVMRAQQQPPKTAVVETTPGVKPGEIVKIQKQWNLPIGEGKPYPTQDYAEEFLGKVETISSELGIQPDHLMAVIAFETGGTFDPSIPNGAGSGATGLIQFMPKTAEGLGTTVGELADMTPIEQLDFVRQYFISSKGQLHTLPDVYLKVFFPAGIGKGDGYTLPDWVYPQNSGFDENNDGGITVDEISSRVQETYDSVPILPSDVTTETEQNSDSKVVEVSATDQVDEIINITSQRTEAAGFDTIEVKGIRIRVELAENLASLLVDAKDDGIDLVGYDGDGGFRTNEEQIQLRIKNCGPSDFEIYVLAPGKCNPATAIPGTSNHEDGQAIDFADSSNHGSPVYKWLAEHAEEYGFHNLPSEPWHWSTNGK